MNETIGSWYLRVCKAREADIANRDNRLAHALEGRSDEIHCSCCAPLRAEVAQLHKHVARWQRFNDSFTKTWTWEEL